MDYLPVDKRTPDTEYQTLLQNILETGREVKPIHGEKAYMKVGMQMRFNMKNGFPLSPLRDLTKSFPGAIGELIGFMHGAHTLEELQSYGCPKVFWERWVTKERCDIFDLPEHELGPGSYGPGWTSVPMPNGEHFNQFKHLIKQIKDMPYLRTHLLSPWIPFFTLQHKELKRQVVVAPCHGWVHILAYPETKEFTLHHFQRSGDVPVGVALNMIEYASLGLLLEREIGYSFTEYVHTISDAHMYESQIPYVKELLDREPRILPTVTLDKSVTDMMDARREDFTVEDYNPHPHMIIPTPT
jgi:thymidylate synthase